MHMHIHMHILHFLQCYYQFPPHESTDCPNPLTARLRPLELFTCMGRCVYIYIYIYIVLHTHICICMYLYISLSLYIYIYIYVHNICFYMYTYVYIYIYMTTRPRIIITIWGLYYNFTYNKYLDNDNTDNNNK